MFTAYFQADGDHRHVIATCKLRPTAEIKMQDFVDRITHPSVGLWWVWVEEEESCQSSGQSSSSS